MGILYGKHEIMWFHLNIAVFAQPLRPKGFSVLFTLTLKEPEYLVNLKAGEAESARGGFRAPVWSISMQIIHKRVSNES